MRAIRSFVRRYDLNSGQKEINAVFSDLVERQQLELSRSFLAIVPTKMVCVSATPVNIRDHQMGMHHDLQKVIALLPIIENEYQEFIFILDSQKIMNQLNDLKRLGIKYGYYFFISEQFHNINEVVGKYIKMIDYAKKVAVQFDHLKTINYTDQYNIYILLNEIGNHDLLTRTMCAQLAGLKHYDEIHQTDYFHTLYTYLKNDCAISVTSRKLHLHRNSLTNRLKKIVALTHFDLESHDKKFGIRLSCRLLRYLKMMDI